MGSENNLFFDCFHFPGFEELKFSNGKDELLALNKCAALLVALSIRKGALCPREETLPAAPSKTGAFIRKALAGSRALPQLIQSIQAPCF